MFEPKYTYYAVTSDFPFKINSYRSISNPYQFSDRHEFEVLAIIDKHHKLVKYYKAKMQRVAKHDRTKIRKKLERIEKHLDVLMKDNAEYFI